jgi:hypothetical protein
MNCFKSTLVVIFAGATFSVSLPVTAQRSNELTMCLAGCNTYPPDHPCGSQCGNNKPIIRGATTTGRKRADSLPNVVTTPTVPPSQPVKRPSNPRPRLR